MSNDVAHYLLEQKCIPLCYENIHVAGKNVSKFKHVVGKHSPPYLNTLATQIGI